MRIEIIPKEKLSNEQLLYLKKRLLAPEHEHDKGPPHIWDVYQYGLYAFVLIENNRPIAIAEASATSSVSPGWWIDSKFRGQGYGNELVDLLAGHLKERGVTEVGVIPIDTYQGKFNEQSSSLAKRFKSHF